MLIAVRCLSISKSSWQLALFARISNVDDITTHRLLLYHILSCFVSRKPVSSWPDLTWPVLSCSVSRPDSLLMSCHFKGQQLRFYRSPTYFNNREHVTAELNSKHTHTKDHVIRSYAHTHFLSPLYSTLFSSLLCSSIQVIEQLHILTNEVLRVYPSGSAAAAYLNVSQVWHLRNLSYPLLPFPPPLHPCLYSSPSCPQNFSSHQPSFPFIPTLLSLHLNPPFLSHQPSFPFTPTLAPPAN